VRIKVTGAKSHNTKTRSAATQSWFSLCCVYLKKISDCHVFTSRKHQNAFGGLSPLSARTRWGNLQRSLPNNWSKVRDNRWEEKGRTRNQRGGEGEERKGNDEASHFEILRTVLRHQLLIVNQSFKSVKSSICKVSLKQCSDARLL